MLKRINKILLFCMANVVVCIAHAQQNLVPNPGFEDTLGCPQGYPDLDTKCQYWKSFRVTPDYMNNCSGICGYYNQYGYQQPHTGSAYAGFATYHVNLPNAREHIGVQLSTPLIIGTKYYVSFYVTPAFNVQANIAANKIGAQVTTYTYYDPNGDGILPNNSTVKTDSIITDTLNWHKIFGSFIADSAYQYLIIGIFYNDLNVDTLHLPELQFGNYLSYYYLDDVCLSTDSIYAQTWASIPEPVVPSILSVFPNPTSNTVTVLSPSPISEVNVINLLGETVISAEGNNNTSITIPVDFLAAGTYSLRIKAGNEITHIEIIITH